MSYEAGMPKRILFVDDDPGWRQMVGTWLKDAGYEVLAVADATQALLQTADAGLGLIILDLDLGGENGLMLMKFLQRNHPDVPIMLYTGMEHEEEAVARMRAQGARRYVQKGGREDLLRAIEAVWQ
jgi:DNA-binding response OmpR family regulator